MAPRYSDNKYDYLTEPSVHDSVSQVSSRYSSRRSHATSPYDDLDYAPARSSASGLRRDRRGHSDLRRTAAEYSASAAGSSHTARQQAPSAAGSDRTVRASRRSSHDYDDGYARQSLHPADAYRPSPLGRSASTAGSGYAPSGRGRSGSVSGDREMIPYRPRSNSVSGSRAPSAAPSRRSRAPSVARPAEYYDAPHAMERAPSTRTYRDMHSGGGAGRSVHPSQCAASRAGSQYDPRATAEYPASQYGAVVPAPSHYGGSQYAASEAPSSAYDPYQVTPLGSGQPHDISPYNMDQMANAYDQPLQSGEFVHNQIISVRRADGTELRYASSTRAKDMNARFHVGGGY